MFLKIATDGLDFQKKMTENWLPTIHLVHPDSYEISETEEFALSSIFAKNSCSVPKKWNRADFTPLTNRDAKYFDDVLRHKSKVS